MRTLFFIFLTLSTVCSVAQYSVQGFHGSVVLNDDSVLVGEIAMEMKHDVILFRDTTRLAKVFHASRIRSFRFYDPEMNVNRKFTVIQQNRENRNGPRIFEIVTTGEVGVIRRMNNFAVDEGVSAFDYFVFANERVIPLNKFRTEVYPKMMEDLPLLEKHLKKSKLDPNISHHIIQIIDFYNMKVREDIFASAD